MKQNEFLMEFASFTLFLRPRVEPERRWQRDVDQSKLAVVLKGGVGRGGKGDL